MAADAGDQVLILAPLGRDAAVIATTLSDAGVRADVCDDFAAIVTRLDGAGTLVLAEEALTGNAGEALLHALDGQPPWSDVPVIVLMLSGRGEPGVGLRRRFARLGNVTLLERPVRVMTLLTTVESALRARRRQYEVRDHLLERERIAAELRAESRAKDEFLAMLGHELRNPLAAIAAAAHLLDTVAPPDVEPAVTARRVIGRQLRHVTRLVDDLLDVSRVTTGKIVLSRRPLDVAVTVANAVAVLRSSGRLDNHTVEMSAVSAWVDADEVRLDQIVTNLVVNALKYTPVGGRIDVTVEACDSTVCLAVRDSGIGIAPDLLPRVFDLFVQAAPAIERTQGGLGIGLTLVRRLVELHGGTVEAQSHGLGHGSTFVVRLPARAAAPSMPARAVRVPATGARRVLVVEDHHDAREMLAVLLKQAGHEVYEAADGVDGLALALRERPDAAIIDVGLPGLDGYEVARRIRAGTDGAHMLLVAVTGYGLPEDRRRALDAGFDRHLVKPVEQDQLADALAVVT
jgi:signal transduction histidine kinase